MTEGNKTIEKIDKETIERIKSELLIRKKQVLKDLEEISERKSDKNIHRVKFPEFGDKTDENAQEIDEYSTNFATDKVLHSTLRDINNTLERMEKGEYGICKYCHNPIDKKRLLARPVASACIKCKTKLQNQV